MRYLFLDVDGVLNNKFDGTISDCKEKLSKKNLSIIKKLFDAYPDIRVVLTSEWRHDITVLNKDGEKVLKFLSSDVQYLRDKLAEIGTSVYDITENYTMFCTSRKLIGNSRSIEIFNYIFDHLSVDDKFAIIDDECIDSSQMFDGYFVRTWDFYGIGTDDVKRLKKILQ